MRPSVIFVGLFLLLAVPTESAAKAILITHGDTISHVGSINVKEMPQNLALDIDGVGYKYSYFGVFWLDLWRYDGQFCVYKGDRYDPVSEAQAAALLGIPETDLSTPFFYCFPPGLIVVAVLVLVGASRGIAKHMRKKKVMALVGEPIYQRALEIFSETTRINEEVKQAMAEKNEPAPAAAADPWEAAISHLVASGVERGVAEEKFAQVLAHALEQMAGQAQP